MRKEPVPVHIVTALANERIRETTYTRSDGTVVNVPVDVGVRREIRTASCQRLEQQVLDIADMTGENLVEVSSHVGARPSHAKWHGRVYMLNGSSEKYRNYYEATKAVGGPYADWVNGFGGYNCYHTIRIFHEGEEQRWSPHPEEGTGYTNDEIYELRQKQRALENDIRKQKRAAETLEGAGLDASAQRATIRERQKELRELIGEHDTVLSREPWREQVAHTGGYLPQAKGEQRILLREHQRQVVVPMRESVEAAEVARAKEMVAHMDETMRAHDMVTHMEETMRAHDMVAHMDKAILDHDLEVAKRKANITITGARPTQDKALFARTLDEAATLNPHGGAVDRHTVEEIKDWQTWLADDGLAGFAIKPDGDITCVFRDPRSQKRGAVTDMMLLARESGGVKMDCYGRGLVNMYSKAGYTPVARVPFNPEYAEDTWLLENKPDVYVMMKTDKTTAEVIADIESGNFKKWTQEELDALPTFDDYDAALSYRDEMVQK